MRFQGAFSSIKNKLKAEQQQTRCILFELLSFLGDDSSKHLNKQFFSNKKKIIMIIKIYLFLDATTCSSKTIKMAPTIMVAGNQ